MTSNSPVDLPTCFGFLLINDFTLISMSSAIEPLRMANRLCGEAIYSWKTLSETGAAVNASDGLSVNVDNGIDDEEALHGLDAVIVCERGGRLRFEILDWLNHVVYLALFDGEGFLTYSVPDNQYAKGPDDPMRIQEILGIPLTAEELVALALGDPFFLFVANPVPRVHLDQGTLLLDVEPAGLGPRYRLWLDDQTRPERMSVKRPDWASGVLGDLQVDYGRYRKIDAVVFPHRIRVSATAPDRLLQVDYQRVVLNESLDENLFRFEPPEGAVQLAE